MPLKVTYKNQQRGSFQKLLITIENNFDNTSIDTEYVDTVEREHTIDNIVDVRLRFKQTLSQHDIYQMVCQKTECSICTHVQFSAKKHASAKDLNIKLNITCNMLNYSEQLTCTDKWIENISMGSKKCSYIGGTAYIIINLEICFSVNNIKTVTFSKLYDDTVLTDFHLSTAEGSVAVHKVCLAAHSDVFKNMFSGPWKETTDGRIKLEGVTLKTLHHLKDYVYLGTLPEEGLRALLVFSSYYFMETLKQECISKLVKSVKPEYLYSLLEFACENNIPELMFAILVQVPDDIVHETYQMTKDKQISEQTNKQ